ncbi:MAG: sensor histidine kinase, partial [Spirulina sp.]
LNARNIEPASKWANFFVGIGVRHELESFFPLLQAPEAETLLKTAYQWASLQTSTRNINTAAERAAKVVFALKTYARYDTTGEKVSARATEGIETVLTLYDNQLKQGVNVIRHYDPSLPEILCYSDELNQVWTNLIHNALQAMDNRGTLTVGVKQQDDAIHVRIADTGTGISPEVMPRIFEPFFTTKPSGEGSGLGLDIARKIVEKHGGQISVESVPGNTCFTVSLPLAGM